MTQSVLLTDSAAPEVTAAVESLEAWRTELRDTRSLAEALELVPHVRAVRDFLVGHIDWALDPLGAPSEA